MLIRPRSNLLGSLGGLSMLAFAGLAAWRWNRSGAVFFALLVLRDLAAAWFLFTRREDRTQQRMGWPDVLAYLSCAVPLFYLWPDSPIRSLIPNLLSILGFTLATVALFELGRSFGVSPANRGRIQSGVYRFVSHPMYIGYCLSEAGMCLLSPWNFPIFMLSASLYALRAHLETRVLNFSS